MQVFASALPTKVKDENLQPRCDGGDPTPATTTSSSPPAVEEAMELVLDTIKPGIVATDGNCCVRRTLFSTKRICLGI